MDDTAQIIETANALPTLAAKVNYLRPLIAECITESINPHDMTETYHRLASHYIALFAETYHDERRKSGLSPHTIRSDNTFFSKHFLNLQVSNYDQVFKYCNEATFEVKQKLSQYLWHVHKNEPIDGLEDLAMAYKEKKQNITAMSEELRRKKPFKVGLNEILPKVNALTPDKLSIDRLLAIKLACLFCLHGDPGLIKLRNYNKNKDMYVEDSVVHLRIRLKDKHSRYKGVHKSYTMTHAERVALAHFMRQNPDQTYLFHEKPAPTRAQLAGCFTANLKKWMKAIGHAGIGVQNLRASSKTAFGESIKDLPVLEQERLWSQYAHEHGHTLKTVLTYYKKRDADIVEVPAGSTDMVQDVDMDEIAPGDTDAPMEDVPAGSADVVQKETPIAEVPVGSANVVQEAPMVQVPAGSANVYQAPPVKVQNAAGSVDDKIKGIFLDATRGQYPFKFCLVTLGDGFAKSIMSWLEQDEASTFIRHVHNKNIIADFVHGLVHGKVETGIDNESAVQMVTKSIGSGKLIAAMSSSETATKPVLKWVGSKIKLISVILQNMPSKYNRFIEPFLGSAAVLLSVNPTEWVVGDINARLIHLYQVIRDAPNELITELSDGRYIYEKETYYTLRQEFNSIENTNLDATTKITQAALMLYLNRTCYNGMYCVNKNSGFNILFGKYKNPKILDADAIQRLSRFLSSDNGTFIAADFKTVLAEAKQGDFVYLDPPYDGTFSDYDGPGSYGRTQQEELYQEYVRLDQLGCKIMMSNSKTDYITDSDKPGGTTIYNQQWIDKVKQEELALAKKKYQAKMQRDYNGDLSTTVFPMSTIENFDDVAELYSKDITSMMTEKTAAELFEEQRQRAAAQQTAGFQAIDPSTGKPVMGYSVESALSGPMFDNTQVAE
ncbi:hypothetical protein GGF31_003404 [Allomyces arbusculus]|nr:hypothetical protein GGF31_003404 [Allomyces arbusculus]